MAPLDELPQLSGATMWCWWYTDSGLADSGQTDSGYTDSGSKDAAKWNAAKQNGIVHSSQNQLRIVYFHIKFIVIDYSLACTMCYL